MAVNAVKNGKVPLYQAAKTYAIPYTTLYRRSKSEKTALYIRPRTKPLLGLEKEKLIVAAILDFNKRGFGLTRTEVNNE